MNDASLRTVEADLIERLAGKEIHFRLATNDLLEDGIESLTLIATGSDEESLLRNAVLEKKAYTEYSPQSILGKFAATVAGKSVAAKDDPGVVVVVLERNGSVSADDLRYIEWLSEARAEAPRVIMLPETGHHHKTSDGEQPHHLLAANEEKRINSFWKRQFRRLKALPAPITKDAALVAIPRTFIPVAFSVFLAYLKRDEIPLGRSAAYVGLAFGFNIGFALFSQTVFNWFTFWSEFSRDAFGSHIRDLESWIARQGPSFWALRYLASFLGFISARGDVLIAAPLLGVGTMYLARLVLGPVGETVSVLTLRGFLLVLGNVIIGSIAGGPYPQVIAHLRSVGKITNKVSIYLGIVETIKMEVGRVADFGMQVLYNAIQGTLAVVFWILLLIVDRSYVKPHIHCLQHKKDIDLIHRLLEGFKAKENVKNALLESPAT